MNASLPLAVTLGEPCGIGPELIVKACAAGRAGDVPPFAAIGDATFLAGVARQYAPDVTVRACTVAEVTATFPEALPVIDSGPRVRAAGGPSRGNAPAVIGSIAEAARLVREGAFAGMVTGPIAKHLLQGEGFAHPGHTEFLGELAQRLWDKHVLPVMMLWCAELAVVPVTVHLPLAQVPERLTSDLIVATGRVVARDLSSRFGVAAPRLAVTGLNPHAGESGMLGHEEERVIAPAIARLRADGIAVTGPHPADVLFHREARHRYDAALTMYHDQALIPIKTIAFDDAVNVTLGLPFIRTSPDHGTAFDIAGKGVARPDSFIAALKLAARLARRAAGA